ncbi:hypothetical protein BDR26DRAFT_1013834 [Obelidium mucronatum]|nr:hypothetical protein BDR26DRAFT_1013834 [Obelidium mucronatum]
MLIHSGKLKSQVHSVPPFGSLSCSVVFFQKPFHFHFIEQLLLRSRVGSQQSPTGLTGCPAPAAAHQAPTTPLRLALDTFNRCRRKSRWTLGSRRVQALNILPTGLGSTAVPVTIWQPMLRSRVGSQQSPAGLTGCPALAAAHQAPTPLRLGEYPARTFFWRSNNDSKRRVVEWHE